MRAKASIALVLLALLAASGCTRCDRGADPSVTLVARSLNDTTTLAMLDDGTVLVDTGVFVFRVRDEGALERIGDLAAYRAFLPPDDATPRMRRKARAFFGTKDAPSMIDGTDGYAFTEGAWRGAVARVAVIPSNSARSRELRRDTSTAAPPPTVKELPRIHRQAYRKYPDGTFVGFGRTYGGSANPERPITVVVRPGAQEETEIAVPDATSKWTCAPAPSADGRAYLDCRAHDGVGEERRLYVLDEHTWARVPIPSRDLDAPIAVTKDHAVWMALANPARLVMRTPGGRITGVTLPARIPQSLARASYGTRAASPLPLPRHHDVSDVGAIVDLAPMPNGTLVILAREQGADAATAIFRVGGAEVAHADVIGSEIDQLVEIRNAEPPKRWIGHCLAVFVPLPRGRLVGSLALEVTDGTFAEGRLGDKTVTGAVFTDDGNRGEPFERAIAELVEKNAANPAAPPDVTCTLPVLEKVD